MKKRNIFKGVLLWTIVISITLFAMAIDSLSLAGIVLWMTINIILVIIGKHNLTLRDIYCLSGTRFIDKVFE